MTRYSNLEPETVLYPERLFETVAKLPVQERERCLLLVGGNSPKDIAVRNAQSIHRWDQLPSYWSHSALILRWPRNARPEQVLGLECALLPRDPREQVPERNGVTPFVLSDYLDEARYPNIAFVTGKPPEHRVGSRSREALEVAVEPNRDRGRYPFWAWLGAWQAYCHGSPRSTNPLLEGWPLPATAFCEYVFQALGVDITPGGSNPGSSPETLWASALRWSNAGGPSLGKVTIHARIERDQAPSRVPLGSLTLALDQLALAAGAEREDPRAAGRASSRRRRR
jgi:hypothetical protein